MQSIEKLRLAIITEDDGIWALSLWERTIAKLQGEVVAQESVPEGPNTASMVAFNLHMFRIVPTMLMAAIRNVLENRTVQFAAVEPSYFGLPDKDVVRRFRRQGGKIVRLSDIGRAQEL
jgi:hypothetical protein